MTLLVRTAGDISGTERAIRAEIAALDPALPVPEIRPLERNLSAAVAGPRFRTLLLGAFAAAALLLAAIGVYGVMAFNVNRRTREMGLRLALGARPGSLLGMLFARGTRLVAIGAAFGLFAAFVLTRFLQELLYQTATTDPLALAIALTLLAGVGMLAIWLPARRAARVDPMQALRQE